MTNIRFGLCCLFLKQPIKFRNTTVKSISGMERDAALNKLSGLCLTNADALQAALQFCADNGSGCLRFIDVRYFPECWDGLTVTVEFEAKAKEVAVLKLMKQLSERWFVYILRCSDGSLYTGIAKDVDRRLEQHNAGTASRYTRSRLPVALVYREEQRHQSMGLKRELAIKALSREAKEGLIRPEREMD